MILIRIGMSTNRWFDNQKQVAEFLNIKNTSKKSIEARCRVLNFEIEYL
jgi:hypothetical protein